ncbi:MAG: SDR family oxidoreductase [Pyrinomonadaceae bacterium]|nr:SDR family oxidoreductase [Pyrinomonadaceae bacterium]
MTDRQVMIITGTRKGIGRFLAEHYAQHGFDIVGCSRTPSDLQLPGYQHYCLEVADEAAVKQMFLDVSRNFGRVDVLLNNAGIASMNHFLLTPLATAQRLVNTNFLGTFLFCREAAKLMRRHRSGRIVNFTTVATPLDLEGEAIYAATKAAVESLTRVLARELAAFNVTVNAVGPTPVKTDLTRSVPQEKLDALIARQAIQRYGELRDILNVVDFFIRPASDFITAQVIYLGGVR